MSFLKKAIFGTGVVAATITLFAPAALAVSCVAIVQATDEMDFGYPKIGTEYSDAVARGAIANSCPELKAAGYGYSDCGFADVNGARYTVFEGVINRKDLLVEKTTEAAQYPFGLSADDDLQTVVQKISSYSQTSYLWVVAFDEDEITFQTHYCFTNELGSQYSIAITFDRENLRMSKLTLRENW